ncbi:MAG: hypothetical protein HC902_03555 [Calothrix sp. SM1_5_4]|nr:hypothetical protein [Calothrix sp. SM1_5_4]
MTLFLTFVLASSVPFTEQTVVSGIFSVSSEVGGGTIGSAGSSPWAARSASELNTEALARNLALSDRLALPIGAQATKGAETTIARLSWRLSWIRMSRTFAILKLLIVVP